MIKKVITKFYHPDIQEEAIRGILENKRNKVLINLEISSLSFNENLNKSKLFRRKFWTSSLISFFSIFSGFIYIVYGSSVFLKRFKYSLHDLAFFNLQIAASLLATTILSYFSLKYFKRKTTLLIGISLEISGVLSLILLLILKMPIWILFQPNFLLMLGFNLGLNLTFQYYLQDQLFGKECGYIEVNYIVRFGAIIPVMIIFPWALGLIKNMWIIMGFLSGWYFFAFIFVIGFVRETFGKTSRQIDDEFSSFKFSCCK